MNEMLQLIKSRRSVRAYRDEMIPREIIDQIVEAGSYAPTGKNLQSPIIVALTNREIRDRLSKANAEIAGTDGDPFYGAPVVLIVLVDKSCPTHVYDGSVVMENLMLAARALGVGSCWIHRAKQEFEQPEWKQWLQELGVEGEYEGVGHCILGYPAQEFPEAQPRKEKWVFYAE